MAGPRTHLWSTTWWRIMGHGHRRALFRWAALSRTGALYQIYKTLRVNKPPLWELLLLPVLECTYQQKKQRYGTFLPITLLPGEAKGLFPGNCGTIKLWETEGYHSSGYSDITVTGCGMVREIKTQTNRCDSALRERLVK